MAFDIIQIRLLFQKEQRGHSNFGPYTMRKKTIS